MCGDQNLFHLVFTPSILFPLLVMYTTIHCDKFKIMVLCKIYINISCKKAEIFWLPYGDSSVYFGFNIVISQIFRIENPFLL